MPKILITSEYFQKYSDEGKNILLNSGFQVIDNPLGRFLQEDDIISCIGDADGIICDLEKISAKVIRNAPKLKIIARRGVGVDSVDLDEAQKRGITVARTLGVVEKPVAELVMSYILGFSRKIMAMDRYMKSNTWKKELGRGLEGKILGVVGLGNIAQEVVRKAKAFDMQVVYFTPNRSRDKEARSGAEFREFDRLLGTADFISIHAPLTEATRNMFTRDTFSKMKPTSFLINTARGAIVNEEHLAEALKEGSILGAAIDVYDVEPKKESPLMKLENVILTPHVGTYTKETFIKMDILAALNVAEFFKNQ